jgi:hypothetical protein
MAGIFKVKRLEARRQALLAESELYRQTLKLEVQNLRLCAAGWKHKLTSLSSSNPLFMLAPLLGMLFQFRRRKPSRWASLGAMALTAWKLGGKVFSFFRRRAGHGSFSPGATEEREPVR